LAEGMDRSITCPPAFDWTSTVRSVTKAQRMPMLIH
jgi:hypothetical protein